MKNFIILVLKFVAAVVVFSYLMTPRIPQRDDTDPPNGISGMGLFTDAASGCQYLGYGSGAYGKALTPRIAGDGKTHMGCHQ